MEGITDRLATLTICSNTTRQSLTAGGSYGTQRHNFEVQRLKTLSESSEQPDVESLLLLWAQAAREMPHIGYPKQVPWYVPTGYRESRVTPSDKNLRLAERVGTIVNQLEGSEEKSADLLRIYYWAYPGEPKSKKDRMRIIEHYLEIRQREIYRRLDALKRLLEGALFY
jgi:hypothetical protein